MEWLQFRDPVSTWTHLIWMILAVPATVVLWQRSRGDLAKQLAMLVFGLCLILCFGASALYHSLRQPRSELGFYITLDYIGIYALIAGSCTPIVFTLIQSHWKWLVLITVWLAAVAGSVTRTFDIHMPTSLSTTLYLAMGWGLLACYPSLARALSHRALRLLLAGGIFYSLGAVAYVINWPVLWPGVIGAHEVLHFCDMAGSLSHFLFILIYVTPYERVGPAPILEPATGSLAVDQSAG